MQTYMAVWITVLLAKSFQTEYMLFQIHAAVVIVVVAVVITSLTPSVST